MKVPSTRNKTRGRKNFKSVRYGCSGVGDLAGRRVTFRAIKSKWEGQKSLNPTGELG